MKKVKIGFWVIIFGFIGLIIFQNKAFFMLKSQMLLNLGFFDYQTPLLPNAIYFVAFFLIGILISFFFSLVKQFRDGKTIKSLKARENSLMEKVAALEKQVSALTPQAKEPVEAAGEPQTLQPATES